MQATLDEILGILKDIQADMGGIAAKKIMPKPDLAIEVKPDPMAEGSPEEEASETPEEEKSEMDSGNEEDISSLPRWKQRLHEYGKKKIGM